MKEIFKERSAQSERELSVFLEDDGQVWLMIYDDDKERSFLGDIALSPENADKLSIALRERFTLVSEGE